MIVNNSQKVKWLPMRKTRVINTYTGTIRVQYGYNTGTIRVQYGYNTGTIRVHGISR